MNFEYIKTRYKVPAELGRDVTVSGRKGTITKSEGQYIGVVFHDDRKFNCRPCHPTWEVIYLDTFTDIKKLRPKNHKARQRYLEYLNSDSDYSFREWLGIKSVAMVIVCFFSFTSCKTLRSTPAPLIKSPKVSREEIIRFNNTLNYLRTRLAEHKIDSAEYKRLIDNRPELAAYFGYKPY